MAFLKEYQDYKTKQEAFRKMVGTLQSLEEDWQPFISSQVASQMEASSPCIPCVLINTSQAINYPKPASIATTNTSPSGGTRVMGSGTGSGLKTQQR
ncbi:hypothetical protein O181_012066 [Austropuccinia psidii MF-1]|uniref:Uncharacterized protein n=1 Tax=Austropuccinia psidii MF-1 TaxID=1389203 RepID=A0A9Q3BTY3_9BASI|nr:hypothetical protein [Austropuccinia psidii MF-1]